MKATDTLMSEHRVIEQVLAVLEQLANHAERANAIDAAAVRESLDFFWTFADRCHHAKEERYLFPLLEDRGLPREGGPTGVMFREHEIGRELLARIAGTTQNDPPPPAAIAEFIAAARAYVTLRRDHIWKEDQRLFGMAEQMLGTTDDDNLMQAFASAEHDEMGAGTHEAYLSLANRLADRFGVPKVDLAGTAGTHHNQGCSLHGT